MRNALLVGLGLVCGCAAQGDPVDGGPLRVEIPRVYPPVREATPTELIANAEYAAPADDSSEVSALGQARLAQSAPSMATTIQERFYTTGPTALLRIVKDLDDRVAGLETDPRQHECLSAAPVTTTYTLPGGQAFQVKLQCLMEFAGPGGSVAGWVAFGFDAPAGSVDAGPIEATEGNDFYVVEGQSGGMGGAYRLDAAGNVEGWIAVADQSAPTNSQVLMHLLTSKVERTLELALAGSGVGFCGAHLKTDPDHVFVSGKMNGAAPPGSGASAGAQFCDSLRSGCFAVSALGTDLGGDSPSCAAIAPSSFEMSVELDASSDASANVDPATIYDYFNDRPVGVAAF
jgi:hypothetical protein